jgi:hypothetical protein
MRSLQCPNAIAAFVPGKFAPKHGRVEALLAFRMNQAYNKPLTANIWGMSWKTFLGTRFCRMFAWSKKNNNLADGIRCCTITLRALHSTNATVTWNKTSDTGWKGEYNKNK